MNNDKTIRTTLPSVLIVSINAHPHVGGLEVVVDQQARSLTALGHEVTVVTSRWGKHTAKYEKVDGYTVIRIPSWNGLEERHGIPYPLWSPSAVWRLARMVGHTDIVHVHDVSYMPSILAAALSKWRRRPLFITQHVGIVEHDMAVKLVQKLVFSSVGQLLWRWATTITVYNPIVEGFLRKHGVRADKIRLSNNGIDTSEFSPAIDLESVSATRRKYGLAGDLPVVLFVGRLVPKKGFQKLIDARGPEYEVVVIGPGKIPSQIPDGVKFLGPVNRRELRDLYQASDIFAFPAVGEMLTLAMQEAMACGLPVVTTAEQGYEEYSLDPSGIALVSPEPQVLRSTFLNILADSKRMRQMQVYSRHLAEQRFDWRRNAERLASDYNYAYESYRAPIRNSPNASLELPLPSVAELTYTNWRWWRSIAIRV